MYASKEGQTIRYQIGDRVSVLPLLENGKYYYMEDGKNYDSIVTPMLSYMGQTVTIRGVRSGGYHIEEDSGCYNWTDGMFSGPASDYDESSLQAENLNILYAWAD